MGDVNQNVSSYYEWKEQKKSEGDFGIIYKDYSKVNGNEVGRSKFNVQAKGKKEQSAIIEQNSKGTYDLFIDEGNFQIIEGSTGNAFQKTAKYKRKQLDFKGEFKDKAAVEKYLIDNELLSYSQGGTGNFWSNIFGDSSAEKKAKNLTLLGNENVAVVAKGEDIVGDKTAIEKLLADLEKSNEEYYQQFQDKLGGLGGQLFLRENIRQLVLKSKKDELQIGWRKRPVESSNGKKPENKRRLWFFVEEH